MSAMQGVDGISWTDRTWNPVRGCSRVSAGCDNCYAMNMAHRFSGTGKPFEGLTTIRRGKVDWAGVARFIPEQLGAPLKWRKPSRVFVNSMSDLFHPSLSNEEIAAVFGVMAACPEHTFQVLTKQPKRAAAWFKWVETSKVRYWHSEHGFLWNTLERLAPNVATKTAWDRMYRSAHGDAPPKTLGDAGAMFRWPLPNVHLGVSAENQKTADERISILLTLPAAVRFVSAEPLLGPIEFGLNFGLPLADGTRWFGTLPGLDWVIVGGESGPKARPCAIEWIETIVNQGRAAGVPIFVKQLGAVVVSEQRACDTDEEAKRDFGFGSRWLWRAGLKDRAGGDPSEWPEQLRVRQFPGEVCK